MGLAGPMLLSSILQNAQSLIDLFWVGRLGKDAVAALALSGTALMLLFPFIMGLSTGTVALVSRAYGAGRKSEASFHAAQSLSIAILVGIAMGFGMLPIVPATCNFMGASDNVAPLATTYLRISLIGMFSGCLLFVASSAMQGAGNTVLPMIAMLSANVLNMILDPIFIFGLGPIPAWGVAGAAWATVLSQVLAGCMVLVVLATGRVRLHLKLRDFAPQLQQVIRLLRIGLPSGFQMLARSLMSVALFKIVAACGTAAMAGFGIGTRLQMVLLLPCFVFGNAAATLVGQNLGAQQPNRAHKAAWTATAWTISFMLVSGILTAIVAEPIVKAFVSAPIDKDLKSELEVIAVGTSYLRWLAPSYALSGLAIVIGRSLNGAGSTMATMIFTLAALWGLQVPLASYFAKITFPPTLGIWWAILIATLVHAGLTVFWFETGRWKQVKV